ncbi:ABC transporter ATP-binding protein [Arcicella sp. LKC2W]|uniref:ABC transporter ATP-binding protein n=1 Tax=Arcicella sp. LKC2W TaxID=2984198 RepID=UPI002B1F5D41|nr:ABC transporter ATP-binding protein [Arcicella sp. LKC2W]MEA5461945.1 ABC transporter ATP-binding protein [Arcicella sp. LKC2W]
MQNPYISLLKIAWKYARKERKQFVLIYALFGIANVIFAMYPIIFGQFVNDIQKDSQNALYHAMLYALIYVGLKLIEWIFHGPARIMERQLAFNLSRNYLQEAYHQALHLPVKWHQDHHSGATINRIRKAYEALKYFFQNGFMYVHALAKFAFSFIAMFYYSPVFGIIGIMMGVLTVWVIFRFDKPFVKTLEEVNEKEHIISSTLFDSLSNIVTVITLRLEKSMENGLLSKVNEVLPPFRKNVIINEWKWFVADMLVALTYAIIAFGYVDQNWQPNTVFYVGGLVTLLGYVNQFTSVFHDVAWQYTEIVRYNTDVQTAKSIQEAYTESHRAETSIEIANDWRKIQIRNLSFSHREIYDASHAPQGLHNVAINIERGKKIAFIGESGSGKSTLLAILRGLYEPELGLKMVIDGNEYQDLLLLNKIVTLFPQEPEIFENSIEYNITLGLPFEAVDIQAVTDSAQFSEVIKQLPNGLESKIQEKGVNLSGGQKQRLALARGILAARESDVVLLDEPTSSVDPKTEAMIYENLFKTFKDKAIVSTLHRLHLLRYFDYVYILDKGVVVDEGTFLDLRNSSPIFQELWKHQEDIREEVNLF